MKKCPLCGTTKLREVGVYKDQLQCSLCLHTDHPRYFPDDAGEQMRARHVDDDHMAVDHIPPQEVQDALALIERFFSSRGVKRWAFGSIQSRGEDSVLENALRGAHTAVIAAPTMTRDHVRALAAAFGCDLTWRVIDGEEHDRIAKEICARYGQAWGFCDEVEKTCARDIVTLVAQALPRG